MKRPFAARLRSREFNSSRITAAEKVSAFASRKRQKNANETSRSSGRLRALVNGHCEELLLWRELARLHVTRIAELDRREKYASSLGRSGRRAHVALMPR